MSQQPPYGTPRNAPASTEQEGRRFLGRVLTDLGVPAGIFRAGLFALADNESSVKLRRRANNFDNRPPSQRNGRPRVTAFGMFQFNYGAWQRLWDRKRQLGNVSPARMLGMRLTLAPWLADDYDRVRAPVVNYLLLWNAQKAEGDRSPLSWYIGMRAYHSGPGRYDVWRRCRRTNSQSVAAAWRCFEQQTDHGAGAWARSHRDIFSQLRRELDTAA